jgi:hypothetical protein
MQVQYDHGVGGFTPAATPQKSSHAAKSQASHNRET